MDENNGHSSSLWYLCLDFAEQEAIALQCYKELYAKVKSYCVGLSAQRLLLEGHYYLLILGEHIPEQTRGIFTGIFLTYHALYNAEFVTLPKSVLASAQAQKEQLSQQQITTGQVFMEASKPIIVEVETGALEGIQRIPPPAAPDNNGHQVVSPKPKVPIIPPIGKGKPLIEGIITQERVLGEGKIISEGLVFHRQIALALGTTRDKYRWMPSAIAMVEYLRKPLKLGESYEMTLPLHRHFWIELPSPLQHAILGEVGVLYLIHTSDHITFMEAVRSFSPPRQAMEEFKQTIGKNKVETWLLVIRAPDGKMLWNCLYEKSGEIAQWRVTDFHICPSGECRREPERGEGWFHPCESCKEVIAYWTSWLATAYLMLSGAFQEQEETTTEETVEETIRKVARLDKPQKFTEVKVEHRYRVVRFDACAKKTPTQRESQESRGSWVETARAIDPEAIVYVDRHIGQTERHLKHERYTKKRGQVIKVRGYDKRIPMKLVEVRKKIIRVVASKYEPWREEVSERERIS